MLSQTQVVDRNELTAMEFNRLEPTAKKVFSFTNYGLRNRTLDPCDLNVNMT